MGTKINKIAVDTNETAREHKLAEADANADPVKLQDLLGGRDAYTTLISNLSHGKRAYR